MPVLLQCDHFFLTDDQVAVLWEKTREHVSMADAEVTVRCVSEVESQELNERYRSMVKPTNVLTFSYGDGVHDVALCEAVVTREAQERGEAMTDYGALVLVHAFLHVTGMDHEESAEAAALMHKAEHDILLAAGFRPQSLE